MELFPSGTNLYTIGHSNHSESTFCSLLEHYHIGIIVDIRSWPASRRFPHFNREQLGIVLTRLGKRYVWEKDLGGKRSLIPGCEIHTALDSPQLRAYVQYLHSAKAHEAMMRLLKLAVTGKVALMCSERNPENCHRHYLADALTVHHGVTLLHIMEADTCTSHLVTPGVRNHQGRLIYSIPKQLELL